MRWLVASILASTLALAPDALRAQSAGGWPTEGWKSSTPAEQRVDAAVLRALDEELASGRHGYVDAMLVVKNGFVVYEASYANDYDAPFARGGRDETRGPYNYYDPDWHPFYQRGALHTMQSVSKSVTSALVGIALLRDELPSVEGKALGFFEGFPRPDDPRWSAITLRDLLTMTSGIAWDESSVPYTDPANSCARMEASADWVRFVLGEPMAAEPGTTFVYNSGVTMLLAQILLEATGKTPHAYAEEHLFGPLGIESSYWKRTPTGLTDCEGGLYLTARDLAKLGYLYLHDGVWEGRRILPEGWVEESTRPRVDVSETNDRKYGYQWWLIPYERGRRSYAWAALGYGGQRLLVLPDDDTVAVFTGWNVYDRPALDVTMVLERVLEAVR